MNFSATHLPASRLAAGIYRQPENISEKALLLSTIGENRKKRLSSKDWEDLKPAIKTRYVDQQHTIKDLARWIYGLRQVEPSKKQLTYRLSQWDLEKNSKRLEADRLLQKKLILAFHRARQITSAKLARWRRRANVNERVYKKKKIDTKDEHQSIHPLRLLRLKVSP